MHRFTSIATCLIAVFLAGAAPPVKPVSTSSRITLDDGDKKGETKDRVITFANYRGETKVEDFGTLRYAALNRQLQAQGISASLTPHAIRGQFGRRVDGRINPPGWKDDSGLTRLMLLSYDLGGRGDLKRNLVTVNRAAVVPKFAAVMARIRDAMVKDRKTVTFSVTPVYRDAGMPVSLGITADIPLDGERMSLTISNEMPPKPIRQASDLTRLMRFMPPPRQPRGTATAEAWQAVEKRLKITFPDDFKEFIAAYGIGSINEEYFFSNPVHAETAFANDLKWHQEVLSDRKQRYPERHPYDVWPAEGGLLPLGSNGNGDTFFWRTKGKPNEWTIIVHDRGFGEWKEYRCGFVAFLRRVIEDDIQLEEFSSNLFLPKFVPATPK